MSRTAPVTVVADWPVTLDSIVRMSPATIELGSTLTWLWIAITLPALPPTRFAVPFTITTEDAWPSIRAVPL